MPAPTVSEFETALRTRPLNEVVDRYVFSGEPFAFKGNPAALATLRRHLANALPLVETNAVIVGSAQVGWSNKTDFYTLFVALGSLYRSHDSITGK